MRQLENNITLRPPHNPQHPAREDRLATRDQRGARRRAHASQGQEPAPAARPRVARLISGPIPVALIGLQGILTIALAGPAGRGYTHRLLLTVVLAENVVALLSRNRHPLIALTAISLTYAIVDNPPTTLPALVLALLTVLVHDDRRMGRIAVIIGVVVLIASPVKHGDLAGIL